MTAAEVYESVTNGGTSDFAAVVEILDTYWPWCLIDGLAVNHYVEPVYTVDANVVIVADNSDRIQEELRRPGFVVTASPTPSTQRSLATSYQYSSRSSSVISRSLSARSPAKFSDVPYRLRAWLTWSTEKCGRGAIPHGDSANT
jgi:hypothetical protein